MFSGIISRQGTITHAAPRGDGLGIRIRVEAPFLEGLADGASVAVNGACCTVETHGSGEFSFFVSAETLARTGFRELRPGVRVNLERSLCLGDPLDGHLVTGHVDGQARVRRLVSRGASSILELELPEPLGGFVAEKGSLAVDGVSLTVNRVSGRLVELAVIPFTLGVTTLGGLKPGGRVNVEVDILARYVHRRLACGPGAGDRAVLYSEEGHSGNDA